ncbi:hypothetical protein OU789_10790 [Halocynthiibacter sp. C4]|uniref:hypothetical protein n=1 Tax=Halocynthiibacter sp. C4 TaxID=2992758 RepID=UPI00237B18DC|nr:hypothetical protein [Halocynthiibacter sp. C4]MDE0590413.1 hypothetical protein [Halocynthiibacter sp. C4]
MKVSTAKVIEGGLISVEFADGTTATIDSSKSTPEVAAYAAWCRSGNKAESYVYAPSTDPNDYNLTPAQFKWLLAASGLDDVLAAVLAYAKENARETYADLELNLHRSKFLFSVTMELVGQMQAAGAVPEGADVSEATIGALWMQAKDK